MRHPQPAITDGPASRLTFEDFHTRVFTYPTGPYLMMAVGGLVTMISVVSILTWGGTFDDWICVALSLLGVLIGYRSLQSLARESVEASGLATLIWHPIIGVAMLLMGNESLHNLSMVMAGSCMIALVASIFCTDTPQALFVLFSILFPTTLANAYAIGAGTNLLEPVYFILSTIVIALLINRMVVRTLRRLYLSRREVDYLAHHDWLTGLLNRGTWYHLAASTLASMPADSRTAVIYLDLDHFKSINDQHGHAAGDRVLIALAGAITASIPPNAIAARHGGEEFVALLPDADATIALQTMAAIRTRLNISLSPASGSGPAPSVSSGIVDRLRDEHLDDVVRRADEAMYAAKRAGRNQDVVVASQSISAAVAPDGLDHPLAFAQLVPGDVHAH